MDEEKDGNEMELKSHVSSEEVKDDSTGDTKQEETPVIGLPDAILLRNNSNSDNREKNDERESLNPVVSRHLDSVHQYASKIRAFIGLEDTKQDVSSPENEILNDESDDASNQNLKNNDFMNEKLTDSDGDKSEPVLTATINGVPTLSYPSHPEDSLDVKEPENTFGENNEEIPLPDVNSEVRKKTITKGNGESDQHKPEDVNQVDEAESPKLDISEKDEIAVNNVPSDNDEQKSLLHEISEKNSADDVNVTLPEAELEENSPGLTEVPSLERDTNMSTSIPDDKTKVPLLEIGENEKYSDGVDLNEPEFILKDEEVNSTCIENKSNDELLKNQEKFPENVEKEANSKIFHESSTLPIEDNSFKEDSMKPNFSELYAITEEQDSSVNPDDIEQTPHFEDIRRLSVEIVNKVLDTVGNQLRDILNEKRKSNAEAGNLESSSDLQVNSFSTEVPVEALNSEPANVSIDNDRNSLTMTEGGNSQFSELNLQQPEVKHKLNNEIQLKEVLAKTYDLKDFQKKVEVEMNKFDPNYDVDPDTVCGIGCFKPKWIQPWATARVYLVLYSIIGIFSGSYYSYLIGAMSTLEKRFAFKSKTSGLVMMLDEITPLLLGIFIGYFGGKSHRPRMVGFGMLLSSICCFISALPYFIYGPATHLSLSYTDNEKKLELCNTDTRERGHCDDEDRLPTLTPVLLLMLGSFLKGFGNLSYYAVGLAYMDDNAKKKNTPMYFAIAFSLRLLGPVVGFLMSSFFLKYYENPFVDPGFAPTDPRWIGCWWMGFLVQGVLLLIFTIPISLFPRRLPGTVDYTASQSEEDRHIATSFVGLYAALKRLSKNPVFLIMVLNTTMGIYGSFGHYINLPRYMENQFRLSASTSSLISAPPSLGAVMVSMTIGGYLIWRFKPGAKFLAAALCASELIQTGAYFVLMVPRCERVEVTSYGFNDNGLILQNECNSNCNCSTSAYSPVCGPDGATMFFSPCHAGCSDKVNGTYSNCSCVSDSTGQERNYVTEGFCLTEDCWPNILAYIITMPIVQIIVNLSKVGHTMIFLRSINPEDKSVALGTFETLICLFGFIPYPIVYGALVDSACLIWEKSCGETGNCWYYDVPKLNYVLHGASALFSTFDALTLLAIFFLSARVHDLYKDDGETEGENSGAEDTQGKRKDSHSSTKM